MRRLVFYGIFILVAIIVIALFWNFSIASIDESHPDLQIDAQTYWKKVYYIDLTNMSNAVASGYFTVTNGTTRNIQAYIFDDFNFVNWANGYDFTPIFDSGNVTAKKFLIDVDQTDYYHIVFDNKNSDFSKEISFRIVIEYNPSFLSFPVANLIVIFFLGFTSFWVIYDYVTSRNLGSIEVIGIGLGSLIIIMFAFSYLLSIEIFNYVGIFVTIANMIILIFNIGLTQRNIKTQLLHSDRKKSLDKLYKILEKSKNFREMKKKIEQFKETLDYQLLPDTVKYTVQRRIWDLEVRLSEAPDAPPEPTQEEIDHHYEQMAEDYQQMTPEERFHVDFVNRFNRAKSAIRESIKDYFEEPSEE